MAIVGIGPKGLFALERLIAHAERVGPAAKLEVDLFEPHPAPGAGPVYDPAQPEYLRMNFGAAAVDMWWRGGGEGEGRTSFVEWRREGDEADEDPYPPRAQVGRYLNDGFEQLLAAACGSITVEVRQCRVQAVRRRGTYWSVDDGDGTERIYDEVLLAVGHARGSEDPRREGLVPEVFPVTHWLSPERVPAGAAVAVRGFALTFIDAALALTEGRGGSFTPVPGHPFELTYERSGDEPDAILPFSRTGRPMLVKPMPELIASIRDADEISRSGRTAILELRSGFDFESEFLPLLSANATAVLSAAGGECDPAPLTGQLADAVRGVPVAAATGPAEEIERSLEMAHGLRPPDLPWALGHTWRTLTPAIVERFGDGGLTEWDWPLFRRLAIQMERISFGPPPANAAKLLALISAGSVDLRLLRRRPSVEDPDIDLVVDAVLAEPGPSQGDALWEGLRADGHIRVVAGRRGLQVSEDGTCINHAGRLSPGLGAVGRPTEDWVIGNDTLDRELHPHPDRWARRVADRAAS